MSRLGLIVMPLFAFTLPSALLLVGQISFTLYVLLSFIVVARYAARKIAVRRLIDGRAAPLSLSIPPAGEWLFIFNVLALLFVESALYRIVALTAVVIFLLADRRLTQDKQTVPRAGAWLFILNVLALLFTRSPLYMVLIVLGQAVLLLENRRTAQKQFGLERLSLDQVAQWSILICGAVIVLAAPLMQIFEVALDALHLSHPEQPSVEVFRQAQQPSQIFDF